MPPDAGEEVARWLRKAMHDRSAVQRLHTPGCAELDVIAFHCQQVVEKALKAVLVHHGVSFPRIHDVGVLLDECARIDPRFEDLRDDVEPLTVFAVAFRYPGPADPTPEKVRFAVEAADRVWAFVIDLLPANTHPQN
jgi:HEPN domain-containing protein